MSKSDAAENALLKLLFQNLAYAGLGDTNGLQPSAAAGNLYFALHTADPGETGNQSTNEANYTGYARVGLGRSSSNFTVTNNTVTLVADVMFGACTAGTNTVTHFSVGLAGTGAGGILYSGALTQSLAVSTGITPRITAAGTSITED